LPNLSLPSPLRTLAATTALLTALPLTAAAEGHDFRNYREVPNNACGTDTPAAAFADRERAAETHERSIDCVADQGIAAGRDGRYLPGEHVTRGQMGSFIARTLEAAGDRDLPSEPANHFSDDDGTEHEDRVDQLAEIGVVEGKSQDRYDPDRLVTRAQMAAFLLRAAGWNHTGDVDNYAPAGDDAYFLDIEGSVHADDIRAGYELWLYEGREPGEYDPGDHVQRDAMATFLTRLLDLIHPDAYRTNNQTYLMSPMEAVSASAGEPVEFSIDLSRAHDQTTPEGESVPGPVQQSLHIALFPCESVDTDIPATFADADADGLADDIASSDTGNADISEVNGEPTGGREPMVRNVPPQDGRIEFTVVSPAADCVVPVAFDDRAPTDELRLDAGHRPANAYGFVMATWS
jgi:hypothetical protein